MHRNVAGMGRLARDDPRAPLPRNAENRNRPLPQVAIRIPQATRDRWHAAAQRAGLTLKDWIITNLDRAAE